MVNIAHAAAFTTEDLVPFEHGVALALASGGKLWSIHAKQGDEPTAEAPDPSRVLERWGAAPASFEFDAVVHECCDDPVDTVLDALGKLAPDLVIAGTHQREGFARALVGSRAEAISHNVSVPTLLIPLGVDGFVSRDGGALDLRRILVPIGDEVAATAAVRAAVFLGQMAGASDVEVVFLHVGAPDDAPYADIPQVAGWKIRSVNVVGKNLEDVIVDWSADSSLVVMATRGNDSLLDVLRGSHTDRVLHRSKCAVLSVPV